MHEEKAAALGLRLPDVTNEAEFRQWLQNALKVPAIVAELTTTEYDDAVIDLVATVVATDATWAKVYALVNRKIAAAGGAAAWDWNKALAVLQEVIAAIVKFFQS